MHPRTVTDHRQQRIIQAATHLAEGDQRVRAAWLAGSYAAGEAGPWSDVDLYVAVRDEEVAAFYTGALDWLAQVEPPHGALRAGFGASRMVGVTMDSGVRLDLFVEPASRVHETPRPVAPQVLLDRDGIEARLRIEVAPEMQARSVIARLVDGYFFGFTWPARLAGRGEWASALHNLVAVVHQFVVPAMLAQDSPEHAYRQPLHGERYLAPARRAEVDALCGQAAAAFAGLHGGTLDLDAVAGAHRAVVAAVLRELRAACRATGVEWPTASEAACRRFYREEFGWEIRP